MELPPLPPPRGRSGQSFRGLALLLVVLGAAGMSYALLAQARRAVRPGLSRAQPSGQRPPAGTRAPVAFQLPRLEGGQVTAEALRGKVILLDFWATWCGPCREEMPTLLKLAREYESKGVAFIAASRDEPDTWRADVGLFADENSKELIHYAAYADDGVNDQFGIEVLPTLVILSASGQVVGSYPGFAEEPELRERIEKARAAP